MFDFEASRGKGHLFKQHAHGLKLGRPISLCLVGERYAASTRRLHCRPPTRAEFVEVIGETLPVNEVSLFLKDGSKVGGNLKIIFLVESRVNFGR